MIQRLAIERGAILFDPERVDAPDWGLFDRARWQARGALEALPGGRGSIHFVEHGGRRWALRRYLRGGMAARVVRDRFLFTGEERTRPFREVRLLARLSALGLPVPAAVAGGYRRRGPGYEAELITARIDGTRPLAQQLASGGMDERRWRAVGRCLRRFHDAGVQHADLNAHNILLDTAGGVWVVDFDRGRLRAPGRWPRRVLARLGRSLRKLSGDDGATRAGFAALVSAHDG